MSGNIRRGEDGAYRWVYEFSMLKNPIILFTVLGIFLKVLLGMWVFFGLFRIGDDGLVMAYVNQAKGLALPALILLGLTLIAYLILAGIYGWKYCVLFEMNEQGIRHIQMEKQFKKAQALGWLTFAVGMAARKPGAAGTGLLSASRNELSTEFSKVRRMRSLRAFHTIKLDGLLNHNQIYAEKEDYDFVLEYIRSRVPEKK